MACFQGLLGGGSGRGAESTEVVRALGLETLPAATAETAELLTGDRAFADAPLTCASYPALAFRLRSCKEELLKESLSRALAAHPMLAGRLRRGSVALTNDGVPFTVCARPEASAPEVFQELMLKRLADFRCPMRVRRGLEPLLTVKLSKYRDGSAVLVVCRSHSLLDGTSAWAFVADWAAAARGEALERRPGRASVAATFPGDGEMGELAQWLGEGKPERNFMCWLFDVLPRHVGNCADVFFLAGLDFPDRRRLFLSDAEVARIKAAACPSGGDGWVSTQEALAAYLMLNVAKAVLPAKSKGRVALMIILDPRKAAGLPAQALMGCGLSYAGTHVKDILSKSLAEVAGEVHEAAKDELSQERVGKRFRFLAGCAERRCTFLGMKYMIDMMKDADLEFKMNNQSKRTLPDFGEASGGRARACLSNAGPTLILPAEGGIDIWLCPYFIGSGSKAQRALEALKANVPK